MLQQIKAVLFTSDTPLQFLLKHHMIIYDMINSFA